MRFQFFILFLTFGVIESYAADAESLYNDDDPIKQLSALNFNQTILNQDHYWIVEFYNRWCGHCIRFAPYWREFARDVEDWRKVVKVAVVDCADLVNVDLCRTYQVVAFPSIKVFGPQARETDQGTYIQPEHNIDSIRREFIQVLKNDCEDSLSQKWPYLCPVRTKSLLEFWQQLQSDTVLFIVDSPSSYIGEEVLLDLSGSHHRLVLKVASNESLGEELSKLTDLSSLPILLQINRDGKITTLARKENKDENVRAKFVHAIDPKKTMIVVSSTSPVDDKFGVTRIPTRKITPVYMQDLENALNYSLRQEVGVHDILKGEKLTALKAYVKALKEYFPGRAVVMKFLNKLFDWLIQHRSEVRVNDMINQMKEMQSEEAHLPPRRQWKSCKGSKPGLRGYPCSLWMLFHTLTVQAYLKYWQGAVEVPQEVLFAIKGYVKNFFSCAECSEHFQQMATNLENDLVNPEDVVLWLWNAHNKANKRLASDVSTNDPAHSKVQFPPEGACPQCRDKEGTSEGISWRITHVLQFLLSFYSKKQIVMVFDDSLVPIRDLENEKFQQINSFKGSASFSEQSIGTWKFRYFNGTDISLCVMLYVVSAVLLMIIYFLFTLRRQRYKMRQYKHFTSYP